MLPHRAALAAAIGFCLCIAAPEAPATAWAASRAARAAPHTIALVDRYARGDFDGVERALASITDFDAVYKDLKKDAAKWIDAGGDANRERRRLAAATFALEAARVGALTDWKEVRMFVRLESVYWHAPAQLVEWGCQLMRSTASPTAEEHLWQMAALAVVGRAQDYEFLIGSPWTARANKDDEINHLEHAIARFPKDRRLLLAQGIAAEWRLYPNPRGPALPMVQQIYANLEGDAEVGAEANVRLGIAAFRSGQPAEALPHFLAASLMSHDPFVTYLAQYFSGQTYERQRKLRDAENAYRAALATIPGAQSATFSLAALLAARGARGDAADVIEASLSTNPRAIDPWRIYGSGDDRFWPSLIAGLRQDIRQ